MSVDWEGGSGGRRHRGGGGRRRGWHEENAQAGWSTQLKDGPGIKYGPPQQYI